MSRIEKRKAAETAHGGLAAGRATCLWQSLLTRMGAWNPAWASMIDSAGIEHRIQRRSSGARFSDAEIFEGLLLSVLSGNTRWSTIERIQSELGDLFDGFNLRRFASILPEQIEKRILPWFLERKAGSTGLKRGLLRLQQTAVLLERYAADHGGAEDYFRDAMTESGGQPEDLAVAIGSSPRWKLPGFGIALAAEALRHIGFDVSKPDRHVLRCMGAWDLVAFTKWTERSDFTAPDASPSELHRTMCAVKSIARANRLSTSYVNSVIWTAGALSGARLTNTELRAVAAGCQTGAADLAPSTARPMT